MATHVHTLAHANLCRKGSKERQQTEGHIAREPPGTRPLDGQQEVEHQCLEGAWELSVSLRLPADPKQPVQGQPEDAVAPWPKDGACTAKGG